ncbi:helix-turn-helix domain-containing protein [Escherichia coli]|uniref:helix-turn-helix domain-containing protein n=1 Tax=Escherichia coli TaxID=562 RepID=UPI000BE52285
MLPKIIHDLVEWIESCLRSKTPVKINVIAHKSGYSLRHIHTFFRNEVGFTLGKYIRLRRITQAALLIKFTRKSISDISFVLKFNSQQSFNRSFYNHFKCTPLDYRKKIISILLNYSRHIIQSIMRQG